MHIKLYFFIFMPMRMKEFLAALVFNTQHNNGGKKRWVNQHVLISKNKEQINACGDHTVQKRLTLGEKMSFLCSVLCSLIE